jgi:outer membrane receptor protein involved in Fe transport
VGVRSFILLVLALIVTVNCPLLAQTETATLSGYVTDPDGKVLVHADVQVVNVETNIAQTTQTNDVGLYLFPNLHPGNYRISVKSPGFKEFVKQDLVLHVQDTVSQNFKMQIGSISESITVVAGTTSVNTEDATVSTVVDRNFAENLPMNGRSFQTLIQLTPGVVATVSNAGGDPGQFSINGQRPDANYWMVDGVSANIGGGVSYSGVAGTLGSSSALGGTNSLVSVDALQEFRILTSTYAPEFGRTPGGQISILTRSGTNQLHGTAFDYLRNNIFDANDWFANHAGLPKPEERQNDFGGTFAGPILKNRAFFFFSYEGLRLRLPETALTTVPDLNARQSAILAVQPYLNAFPLPNGTDNAATGVAQFNSSFSNKATLDAYSLRIDHKLKDNVTVFGRYNYSPSEILQRGLVGTPLSDNSVDRITTQTATVGTTWAMSPSIANDLRFNYSRSNGSASYRPDTFGGAVPPASLPFPTPFTSSDGLLLLDIFSLSGSNLYVGGSGGTVQRQINIVDDLSAQKGSHSLKVGVDFRRLTPLIDPPVYNQFVFFENMASAASGNLLFSEIQANNSTTFLFRNLGVFAQDTWRVAPRLTLTYGLRWDIDFAPTTTSGPNIPGVANYGNLAQLSLAPPGTPPFKTPYGNVAPRLGIAYQLSQHTDWQTVLRGGFGAFYDLATSQSGNLFGGGYPFSAFSLNFGGAFPLPGAAAAPPPITPASLSSTTLTAFYPHLQLPYTLQWTVSLEQALGRQQTISASYLGASGRRLLQTEYVYSPNPSLGAAQLVGNYATSDYDAFQLQFQRRLSSGLQALASYSWSHSIDTGSAGSTGVGSNAFVVGSNPNANRGPSDYDIRNAVSAGLTYNIPAPNINALTNAILHGWSVQNVIQARSDPPVNVYYSAYGELSGGYLTNVRPDIVSGQPLYLYGPQYPGGKALDSAAFTAPPTDPTTGLPLRQGDLPRNALRGFAATQWDFAVHRDFPIRESLKLQFRAELFNLLNHPNFGPPVGDLRSPQAINPQFGQSIQMLGNSLAANSLGIGGFDPLYQMGGPRSIQFGLKLMF